MTYQPDKAFHPGLTIVRVLKKEGINQKGLADRTGFTEKHVSQIINGEASVTVDAALKLENALGGSASFWINLEKNYQETKARVERLKQIEHEVDLVKQFPYMELSKRGYVVKTGKPKERVENLWKFFGVNSLTLVPKVQPAAFRKRKLVSEKTGAIATWLRCGEIEARKIQTSEFSMSKLRKFLFELRALTRGAPKDFYREVVDMLAGCGVALVYLEHFPSTGVSGAVRWVGDKPVIQLSLFGKYTDRFWFNLFHEIGHLICHGKKERFIEFEKQENTEKEKQADDFAANVLIPKKYYNKFIKRSEISRASVKTFADEIGVHPKIVEGRLKHDKYINWNHSLGF